MDINLAIIWILTFVIHLIGTLAYSVRIAGVRTRRIAVSFALFNILILVSRTSNSFQGPALAKRVEESLMHPATHNLIADFRWLLFSATVATAVGAFLLSNVFLAGRCWIFRCIARCPDYCFTFASGAVLVISRNQQAFPLPAMSKPCAVLTVFRSRLLY